MSHHRASGLVVEEGSGFSFLILQNAKRLSEPFVRLTSGDHVGICMFNHSGQELCIL